MSLSETPFDLSHSINLAISHIFIISFRTLITPSVQAAAVAQSLFMHTFYHIRCTISRTQRKVYKFTPYYCAKRIISQILSVYPFNILNRLTMN